ncbi:MAG: hypothetical protein NC935_07210, partial [Candidatus Omnitrophica bacterium]|nr:hypothetical protein [Candidatus Omnitrophota bacterium]
MEVIILGVLTFVAIILVAYLFHKEEGPVFKEEKKDTSDKTLILNLQSRISSLKAQLQSKENELKIINQNLSNITTKLDLEKTKNLELEKEIEKQKRWQEYENKETEKMKQQYFELKEKLASKEKELDEEFSKNIKLTKEIGEINEKLAEVLKENKAKNDEILILKAKINEYSEKIQEYTKTINQLRDKFEHSSWVTKDDYQALKEEFNILEEELKQKKMLLQIRDDEIAHLKEELEKTRLQLESRKV